MSHMTDFDVKSRCFFGSSFAEPRLHIFEPLWTPTIQNRCDIVSQFAPYDERLNNASKNQFDMTQFAPYNALFVNERTDKASKKQSDMT